MMRSKSKTRSGSRAWAVVIAASASTLAGALPGPERAAWGASPNIVGATSAVLPNTANQQIQFLVSGFDGIAGEDLTFQINDGTSGPTITGVNILTGTIFAANNTGQNGFGIATSGTYAGHVAIVSTTTSSGTVLDNGLLATLTISTAGMNNGTFQINLLGTINGNSDVVLPDATTITPFQPNTKLSIGDAARQWTFNGGGTWNLDSHWSPFAPYTNGDVANFFSAVSTGTAVVTLDGDRVAGSVNFNNAGASYDLEPGTSGVLQLNNGAAGPSITDAAGNHVIGVPLSLVGNTLVTVTRAADTLTISGNISAGSSTISLTGAGKLLLTGSNVYGNTVINSGTLQVGNGGTTGSLGSGAITDNGLLAWGRSDGATITGALGGNGGLTILNGATLTLGGAVNLTGATTVANAGGKAVIAGAGTQNLGAIGGSGSLQVNSGSTLVSNGVNVGGSWTINGNQKIRAGTGDLGTSTVAAAPVLGATSQLDLSDSHLIVQSAGGSDKTSKLAALAALLKTGGAGAWAGPGIVSSNAAADSTHYGVGVFDNALAGKVTFGGQVVDGNSVLVAVAHLGDANDNGQVDIQDQSIVTNHWQSAQSNWAVGDLNLDGFVDLQDLTLVTNNWQQVSVFPLQGTGGGLGLSGGVAAVPEPASLAIVALAGIGMLTRSRRRGRS